MPTQAPELQQLDQFGNGRDLVGLGLGGDLSEREALGTRPSTEQLDSPLTPAQIVGAAQRLAADRRHPPLAYVCCPTGSLEKARLHGSRGQPPPNRDNRPTGYHE